jgi:hypothetical protein
MHILTLCLALGASVGSDDPQFEPVEARVFAIAGTDVQVSLPLPAVQEAPQRLAALQRTRGELLFAADMGSADVRLLVAGTPAGQFDAREWRRIGLGERMAGTFTWDEGHMAFSEGVRPLTLPYRDVDRQAFLVAAGAMLHVHVVALESGEGERFGRERFEQLVRGARFALVRRGAWDDLPAEYRELSHEACVRADSIGWLLGRAESPEATWLDHFTLAEHALSQQIAGLGVARHAQMAHDALAALPQPAREERMALALTLDALGLVQVMSGDVAAGAERIQRALAIVRELESRAQWAILADLALARAAQQDAEGVVRYLTQAYEGDPTVRARFARHVLFDPLRKDERVAPLLTLQRQGSPGRSLGR